MSEHSLNPRIAIGANNPPSFLEELKASDGYNGLLSRQMDLEFRALGLPDEVKSDDDVAKVGKWVVDARKLARDANDERETAKAPLLQAGRDVDAVFGAVRDSLKDRASLMEGRSAPYLLAKQERAEAEARARAAEAARKAEEARQAAEAARRKEEEARLSAERERQRVAEAEREAEAQRSAGEAQALADEQEAVVNTEAAQEADDAAEALRTAEVNIGQAALDRSEAAEAVIVAEDAAAAAEEALAKGHKLSRTAGEGAASTVTKVWKADVVSWGLCIQSLGPLGQFFNEQIIRDALDRASRANSRPTVPGVEWSQTSQVKTHALRKRD